MAGQAVAYVKNPQNNKSVTCSWVWNCFLFCFMRDADREEYSKLSFFNDFGHFGTFAQVFGQVK